MSAVAGPDGKEHLMLPDIGEWKTVREADSNGGPVLMRRDHDRISVGTTTGAFFDAVQWAKVNAEAERIIAEGRQWLAENCRCGLLGGRPAEVVPYACPVHGVACEGCGELDGCPDDCPGPGQRETGVIVRRPVN